VSRSSITILVPVLNEENYVRRAVASLVPADENLDYELIMMDGGSTDCTRQIIEEMGAVNRRIRLASNAGRFQAAAVNRGASIAKPESDIIVALIVTHVEQNWFPRYALELRYVDHGHHAAFDRRAFLSIGGYDESFTHNEDAEFDIRLVQSGKKIWLCSDLGITYFPRKSFIALARQYFNHGSGRATTMFKHRYPPKIRQLLPVGVLGINVWSVLSGISFGWLFFLPGLAYFGICATWGGLLARSERDPACLVSGVAAVIMHHSWAVGFVYRLIRLIVRK
jgi:succinoglycan biosynthesis protein ExoA